MSAPTDWAVDWLIQRRDQLRRVIKEWEKHAASCDEDDELAVECGDESMPFDQWIKARRVELAKIKRMIRYRDPNYLRRRIRYEMALQRRKAFNPEWN